MSEILKNAIAGTAKRIALTYRIGVRTLRYAPMVVAPAVLTELAQHAAEIHLGMFTSLAAFRGLSMDTTRWAFGYAKVAGFGLTILLVARFWAVEGVMARVPRIGWLFGGRLALGLTASIAVATIDHAYGRQGPPMSVVTGIVDFLVSTGLTIYMVGGLFGDRAATLRWSFTSGWPRAFMITILSATAFVPCQLLHLLDHRIAIGSPIPVVVGMMLWDAVFIGLFAALVGSALFVGFRYGPDWRGWGEPRLP